MNYRPLDDEDGAVLAQLFRLVRCLGRTTRVHAGRRFKFVLMLPGFERPKDLELLEAIACGERHGVLCVDRRRNGLMLYLGWECQQRGGHQR
jgi:hypothetical protein